MDEVSIKSSSHSYTIYIGKNIRFKLTSLLTKNYSSILIITDTKVSDLYLNDIRGHLGYEKLYTEVVAEGEQSKNVKTFYELQTKAIHYGLDRESLIIALGGGVVGDLAGFVASTYMRGIDYIQMPTTILAHDSSVGGKVAINHEYGKNLIGSFYPPQMVIYDVQTLNTLAGNEVRSGYAELVKEALIADSDFFDELLQTDITIVEDAQMTKHLKRGIEIKASIVEQDEKEAGIRKFLNLGHTLGHALESELGYGKLTHGEAVAIGLLFALYVSEQVNSIKLPSKELYEWLQKNGYPIKLENINADSLLLKMKSDKKAVNDSVQMVLLNRVADPFVMDITDVDLHFYLTSFFKL